MASGPAGFPPPLTCGGDPVAPGNVAQGLEALSPPSSRHPLCPEGSTNPLCSDQVDFLLVKRVESGHTLEKGKW